MVSSGLRIARAHTHSPPATSLPLLLGRREKPAEPEEWKGKRSGEEELLDDCHTHFTQQFNTCTFKARLRRDPAHHQTNKWIKCKSNYVCGLKQPYRLEPSFNRTDVGQPRHALCCAYSSTITSGNSSTGDFF